MNSLPIERVRRRLTDAGQIYIETWQGDEDAYEVRVSGAPDMTIMPCIRRAATGAVTVPPAMRRDEDAYLVEDHDDYLELIPVADDHDRRRITLTPIA